MRKLGDDEKARVSDAVVRAYDTYLDIADYGLIPSKRGDGGLGWPEQTWSDKIKEIVAYLARERKLPRLDVDWASRQTFDVTISVGIGRIRDKIIAVLEGG